MTLADFLSWMYDAEEDGRVRAFRDLAEVMAGQGRTATADWLNAEADRVFADIEAKRRIVEWHANWPVLVETPPKFEQGTSEDINAVTYRMTQQIQWQTEEEYRARFGTEPPTSLILRLLALPYADHPAYRDEWRA